VIHADLPQNKEVLVHRSGRTGRAGKQGIAIVLVPDNARRYVERTFHSAHIEAQWMRGPTAEQIIERDADAMIKEVGALVENIEDDDRAAAAKLLASHKTEDLVATLVAQLRTSRPAPEVLTEPASWRAGARDMRPRKHEARDDRRDTRHGDGRDGRDGHGRDGGRDTRGGYGRRDDTHAPGGHASGGHASGGHAAGDGSHTSRAGGHPPARGRGGPTTWFTINVGRSKNADPKWIVPLLCRRGGIGKREIGKIQILQRETRVEIATEVSERFAEAVRQPDAKDKHIHIERLDES
jgi:ATP-dependent RNA helicase DeaD